MKPFFQTEPRLASLRFHAAEWLGTPFVPHAMVKGAGADCVHLVAAIYMACGVFDKFETPTYAIDGGQHQKQSQVINWLENHGSFMRVGDQQPGDCLCFKFRQSEHHVGLLLGGRTGLDFIHAVERREVLMSSLFQNWYSRHLTAVFRPVERGVR